MGNEPSATPASEMLSGAAPTGEMPTTPATSEMLEATSTPQSPDAVQKELADLRSALKKANDDAKAHRLKANELDKLKAEIEASKLSETERLQKQYDELKAQHEEYTQAQLEQNIRTSVSLEAAKLGVNPKHLDKVARFIDWEEIDVDEHGKPTNVREVLDQLIKDMPELLSKGVPAPTSGGATNPARSTSTAPQSLSWEVIGKMTPQEYTARAPEIRQWIAEHPHKFGQRLK
jgi:phage-related minor tail protein